MIRLLIFDLDGTLIDSSQDITDAINHALAPLGIGPFSVDELIPQVGSGITRLLEGLISEKKGMSKTEVSALRDEALERFLQYYSEHLLDNTRAYPEVKETLQLLSDYKKAIISNKREVFSRRVLEGLDLLRFFDIVLGSDSVPERKPSPVPVFEVLRRLNVSADESLIIGDSNFDIEAGKAAGVRTVAVTYGYRSRDSLMDADFMIDRFGELPGLLDRISQSLKASTG